MMPSSPSEDAPRVERQQPGVVRRIYVAATYDTKGQEAAFLADVLQHIGVPLVTTDLGTSGGAAGADVSAEEVAAEGSHAYAAAMTAAGADIIVAHMGLTSGGSIGAGTVLTLDDCAEAIDRIAAAALAVRRDVIVLCHGGPIAEPDDAARVMRTCRHCHGFYGASSMERLPTELAITATISRVQAAGPD